MACTVDIPSFFGQLGTDQVMPPLGYYIVKTNPSGEVELPKLWKTDLQLPACLPEADAAMVRSNGGGAPEEASHV